LSELQRALRYYEKPIKAPVELEPETPTIDQELERLSPEAQSYVESLKVERDQYLREARTDLLTELPNRRALHDWVNPQIESLRRRREGKELREEAVRSLELVVIDIDKFKAINDSRGHKIGDQVLSWLAGQLRQQVRDMDMVARIGGEEFVVALAGAGLETAQQRAEEWRQSIAAASREKLPEWGIEDRSELTISLGLAEFDHVCEDYDDVFMRADAALYVAKQTRNAVARYNPNDPSMQDKLRAS
jgi:diguanylate cyclase (GGDEF)-like protein